jgi:type I restriction-modification system DNA methylase subunit
MTLKKSELYSSLWKSCDELRGDMDASQYKDYVLILLSHTDENFSISQDDRNNTSFVQRS